MDVFSPDLFQWDLYHCYLQHSAIEFAHCWENCLLECSAHKWLFQNEEAQHLRYLYKFRMVLLIENLGDRAPQMQYLRNCFTTWKPLDNMYLFMNEQESLQWGWRNCLSKWNSNVESPNNNSWQRYNICSHDRVGVTGHREQVSNRNSVSYGTSLPL